MSEPTFLLIDGHALIYRAYHAFPELSTATGQLINAVYGFTRILLTSIRDFEPTYIAVTYDHPTPTKRAQVFEEYKAHREAMPEELQSQIPLVKKVVTALNMPQFELSGYEADDLIATLTAQSEHQASQKKAEQVLNVVVTGDKDLLQLVTARTHVFMPARGKFGVDTEYDADGVVSKLGVHPNQVPDLKGLMGDASDNIPGVKGVGQKTAMALIQTFNSLEGVYRALDQLETDASGLNPEQRKLFKPALVQKLLASRDLAKLSKELATVIRDVPINLDLAACKLSGYDKHEASTVFEELEFNSLKKLLPADSFELGVQGALL